MLRIIVLIASVVSLAVSLAHAHGPDNPKHQIARLGDMTLESGATVKDLRISYVTHGKLNGAKDNVILLLHGIGANHHSFDPMIGSGKPFDTDRYFIVAPDQFGSTQVGFEHSTSPSSSGLKMRFPQYNLRDMIQAQHKLVTEALGIRRVQVVAGISLGATQAIQYSITHPDFIDGAISIAGAPVYGTQSYHWNSQLQAIIEGCAAWQGGNYSENSPECAGTALATLVNYFFSREWWDASIQSREAFEQFHKAWWGFYLGIQDMRDLHYLSRAFVASSLASTPGFNGDVSAALRSIKARTLFIYSPRDMFFQPARLEEHVRLIPDSRLVPIDSAAGHLICCGVDPQAYWLMGESVRGFMRELKGTKAASR